MPLLLHELHYNLGCLLHQQGDLAGAVHCYRQTIALQPDYVHAHHNLGVTLEAQGQHSAAIECYRQTIALQPDYVQAYNNLGCVLVKQGDLDGARAIYQQAIALRPDWAVLHNNLGQASREPMAAIAAYRRAMALDPTLVRAYHNLGKTLQQQGQHSAAIECFQRVLELDIDHPYAESDCAVSWLAQHQLERGLRCWQRAIVKQSAYLRAYCDWTEQLTATDELTQARIACGRFLRTLLNQTPNQLHLAQTYFHLANTLTTYGGTAQYRQAEQYYQQALHIQPDSLPYSLNLAECLLRQDRSAAAVMVCHAALTHHPHHPQIYTKLGQLLEAQQQWQAAIEYYRQALQPGDSEKRLLPHSSACDAADSGHEIDMQSHARHRSQTLVDPELRYPKQAQLQTPLQTPLKGVYRSTADWQAAQPAAQPAEGSTCDGLNCTACLKQIFTEFNPIHLGNHIHRVHPSFVDSADQACALYKTHDQSEMHAVHRWREQTAIASPPRFTVTIPDGRAWLIPQQNAWNVCNAVAVITPDDYLLADVSRSYPGELPGCQHPNPTRHPILALKQLPQPEAINGTVAVLSGLSGHNYYHWMVDILPRLEVLRQQVEDWQQIDWFWINSCQQPFQRETLLAMGVPLEKVLESDRHPYIQASQLIVPSFAGHLGWLHPWALALLRQTFLPSATAQPERIYISRARADHRRVLNEAALIEALQAIGFVSVTLETMTVAEQVSLFAHAQVIVAPHGGGLTNLIFCQPGTTVVELVSPHYIRHYYWVISQQLSLQHYIMTGQELTCYPVRQLMYPSPLTEDVWVEVAPLQEFLQHHVSC